MFDITAFIREKIFRRPKIKQDLKPGEELSEKQTTKLGYFLLFLMFVAIITSAQWTLNIIYNMVDRPTNIPYCIENLENELEHGGYYYTNVYDRDCKIVSLKNPKFDFTDEYNKLRQPYLSIRSLNKQIDDIDSEIRSIDYNYRENQDKYKISLLEKIANEENKVYKRKIIKNELNNYSGEIAKYEQQKNQVKQKINYILEENKQIILNLHNKLKKVYDDYRIAYLWYKFKIALLSLIFISVVFSILYNFYTKSKSKNSPYSIIFSVAVFAYGLILIQIVFSLIWDLIPHRFLVWLGNLLDNFLPLLYLVQFIWPIIIIGFFGFLVYKIQKRLYSKENVLKRFIRDKKCPNCGNSVDITKSFCPLCDYHIQENCKNCGKLTVKGMPYCSNCGVKQ